MFPPPSRRPALLFTAAALALVAVAGCAPAPQPTPTPTPLFTSEADAFAAAEATYRAYNDAGNARRSGDVSADPEKYLTGSALEADLAAADYLRSQGLRLVGTVDVVVFGSISAELSPTNARVVVRVCLDASQTRLLDADGGDVTPPNRRALIAQEVDMTLIDGEFHIADERESDAESC